MNDVTKETNKSSATLTADELKETLRWRLENLIDCSDVPNIEFGNRLRTEILPLALMLIEICRAGAKTVGVRVDMPITQDD